MEGIKNFRGRREVRGFRRPPKKMEHQFSGIALCEESYYRIPSGVGVGNWVGSVEWDQSVLIGEGSVNEVWRIGYGGGWTEL